MKPADLKPKLSDESLAEIRAAAPRPKKPTGAEFLAAWDAAVPNGLSDETFEEIKAANGFGNEHEQSPRAIYERAACRGAADRVETAARALGLTRAQVKRLRRAALGEGP